VEKEMFDKKITMIINYNDADDIEVGKSTIDEEND
jgi:hypothetical protein